MVQELSLWDTPYLTGVARRQLTGSCRDDLSPYFSLGSCMQGLDMVFDALYGIQLRPCGAVPSGEVWNSDVYKLDVVDCRQGVIGNIYLDLYDRPGKPHQDCHFTIVGGKHMPDGSYQVNKLSSSY